jgi:PAS domain S-box-containing protein
MNNAINTNIEMIVPQFLSGGGEMGQRIREYDWASTSLGPIHKWPQSLRTCLRIMLDSRQPIWIGWGTELIKFYNDPYKAIAGGKHPWALGTPASVVWKDIWQDIGPMLKQVMEEGKGTYVESQLLLMERNGYPEETYYTFSYTPVPGDNGGIAGMFCANTDDTDRIISERQLKTLTGLGKTLSDANTNSRIIENTIHILEENQHDFPFALFYSFNNNKAILAHHTPLDNTIGHLPGEIDLSANTEISKLLHLSMSTKKLQVFEGLQSKVGLMPKGAWEAAPDKAIILPVIQAAAKEPFGFLVVGANPFRLLDEKYTGFFSLIADQMTTSFMQVHVLEEERKRAEALAEIDRAKTAFFTNISHEFRTPLTLMLGSLEELMNKRREELGTNNIASIETTHRNAMRLLRLVNNLLDFSKLEAGRIKTRYQRTDIAKYTADIASSFRSAIENAGLAFHVYLGSAIPPVYIDKEMWEKIVLNLLSNAFKYTLKGSITVTINAKNNKVVLKVKDTGIGIPESELPKLFQRFHRVQNVTGRTHEGTGIGLSLTKELVQLQGGEISVSSRDGVGSEFTVSIPTGKYHLQGETVIDEEFNVDSILADIFVQEADALLEQPLTENGGEVKKNVPTVLVVDDNADMRNYIQRLLSEDYNVVAATNGLDALKIINEQKIDLVVSDIMMPVMDGIQLLKTIKETPHTATLPVILVSARAGEEATIEGFEIGADDYLVKPFSAKELMARVSSQINLARKRNNALQDIYNLFNEVPFAVAVLKGEQLIIEYINQCNLDIWQKSKEQVLGKPLFEANPEVRKGAAPIHQEVYRTGKRFAANEIPFELTMDGKTEIRYFNAAIDPMRDEEGKIIGQLATSIDVTEQVLARRKVEESEERFAIAIEGGELGTYDYYLQTGKLYWSAKNKELFGLPPDAGVDTNIYFKGLHPDDKERAIAAAEKAMQRGSSGLYENEYRTIGITDFKLRWVHSKGKVSFDKDGNPLRFTGITQDITLQKLVDEKIRESESRFRSLAETLPQMIWVSDSNGVIEYYSNKWKEYSGIEDSSKAWNYMIHPEDERISGTAYERSITIGVPFRFEVRLRNAAGEYHWHSSVAEPIKDASGNVVKWVGAITDIQEHKTAQEAIQTLMEKKDEFISIASHELKTPLTSMKASLQLAERLLRQNAEPAILRSFIDKANLQVNKITGLVEELLDVTKIQAGKIALNKTLFSVEEFVKDIVEHLTGINNSHKIIVQGCTNIQLYADKHRLEQVLTNLITNGIKYSPGADTVTIQVEGLNNSLKFSITDFGIGIAADKIPHLFERFYRVQESASMFSGLGLGLYISAEIVRRHGGEIGANSEIGKGSTFWFTIPVE